MKIRILLIEDDKIDQKAFERYVRTESLDYQYDIAGSVKEARTMLNRNTYDVIITDYFLGDGDAFDVLSEDLNAPVIFASGAGDEEVIVQAMKKGACDYLIKDSARNYLKVLPVTIEKIILQDVAKKKLEAAESQIKKLSLVSHATNNPVIIYDKNQKIEWVNNAFTSTSKYELEEVENTSGEIFTEGFNVFTDEEFLKCKENPEASYSYETVNFTKDGRKYWTFNMLTPLLNDTGNVDNYVCIQTNITEKKKIETALIKAKEEAIKSEKAKELFLANMSHEIRTPLNSIVGFTDLLLKGELDFQQKEYLESVKWSSTNLLGIINDILDMSKIESGKIDLEETEVDLNKLLEETTKSFRTQLVSGNVKLSYKINSDLPKYFIGDPVRINQILTNLISNALKFTDQGMVEIKVDSIQQDENMYNLMFSISDTGIGIPKSKMESIFNNFTQAASDTTRKYGGTGLGLPIVKKLVELHNGRIIVQSEEGSGSEFKFNLLLPKANIKVSENEEGILNTEELNKINILVVEDHPMNQLLIKASMSDQNLKYDLANNGKEAIDMLNKSVYDIILMDVHMPEMGGIKATQFIRNVFGEPKRNTPIVAMTASTIESDMKKCISAGMNDYISKPFKPHELLCKIKKWVDKKEASDNAIAA